MAGITLTRIGNDGVTIAPLHLPDTRIAFTSAEAMPGFPNMPDLPPGASLVYWNSHCWAVSQTVPQIERAIAAAEAGRKKK